MKFVKTYMDPADVKELENAKAEVTKQKALIEYLAMMTDVEIPVEEKEGAVDHE